MLVRSFQIADNQWTIAECLAAACTLCAHQESRVTLLRHGILGAVQRSIADRGLALEGQAICASLLAAFSRCDVSRVSLAQNPDTALAIVDILKTQPTRVHVIDIPGTEGARISGFWPPRDCMIGAPVFQITIQVVFCPRLSTTTCFALSRPRQNPHHHSMRY